MRVKGSVVVVTGAASGIGRATAKRFARKGAAVLGRARREAELRDPVSEVERSGGRAAAVPVDVTDQEAVASVAEQAVSRYGKLDVWVNNAGVSLFAPFEASPPDLYRQVIETNYFGYVHGARAALSRVREQGGGVLINNTSVLGHVGAPHLTAYVERVARAIVSSRAARRSSAGAPASRRFCIGSPRPGGAPCRAPGRAEPLQGHALGALPGCGAGADTGPRQRERRLEDLSRWR